MNSADIRALAGMTTDDRDLTSEDLRDAILVALSTGWRPAKRDADTFGDDEQPTMQMRTI